MRLHRLEIEGFGPFRARQTVDLDAFADDGIFLIAGRTGAGKSSVLDAICFGLYGSVPRYEGGEKRLRSDHCEPGDISEVVVEFSTTAGRFRVTRSPEYDRPKRSGSGTTVQPAQVRLEENTADGWVGLAARAVDAGRKLDDILQLTMQQFLQVILLAQNRFARFLLADSRDRQQLLRRLFRTERFEDYQQRFDERRRESEQRVGALVAAVSAHLDQAEDLIAAHGLAGDEDTDDATPDARRGRAERARARLDYRVDRAQAEQDAARVSLEAADEALRLLSADRETQAERDRARAALSALEAREPDIAADRAVLERARMAEGLRTAIAAATRSGDERQRAADVERTRAQTWSTVRLEDATGTGGDTDAGRTDAPGPEALSDELRRYAAERTKAIGAWERAAELERAASERDRALADARESVTTATTALGQIAEELAALPAVLADLTRRRDDARREADRREDLEQQVVAAADRLDAAIAGVRLREQLESAEVAHAAASVAFGGAVTRLGELQLRRLSGMAGELASALVDGEPCAVCGSTAHPHPAAHADPVTADDLSAADEERERSAATEREASESLTAVRVELAGVETRASGRTVEQARAEHTEAIAARDAAVTASELLSSLDAELERSEGLRSGLKRRHDEQTAVLASARDELATRTEQVREADSLIRAARGDWPTVAERLDVIVRIIDAASDLASARDEHEAAIARATSAQAELEQGLASVSFADADEASRALLSRADQAVLDERITDHSAALKKERAVLLGLELRALPEEPIDLEPATVATRTARAAWTASVEAATDATNVAHQLTALIDRATAEHERVAEQAAEHSVLENLAQTLAGRGENTYRMSLETFVLAAELEEIVAAANLRLHDMSDGRYQLQHTDSRAARGAASGLGIVVFDSFTGQTRPAQSLSGGETFLGSLALALGLAEVVTARAGGVQLDTLFIDEGFGSLDSDTLETAMRTLDELRQGGRTVGVISHVEAMQEQIPAQLTVRTTERGDSEILAR
ncbi:MAG: AAA family ATPase [Actinomycetota bacterium]